MKPTNKPETGLYHCEKCGNSFVILYWEGLGWIFTESNYCPFCGEKKEAED
jgi:rubrerythrin